MAFSFLLEDRPLEKLVIIGGGIAGLSCLNALLDNHVSPLLIEGGCIGSPKMCGEFLAPPALSLLENWGIGPVETISRVHFHSAHSQFNFMFPQPAGAMMRGAAEIQLGLRAKRLGGRIREDTQLMDIIPATQTSPFILKLKTGEHIEAETAIFATGRLVKNTAKKIQLPYYGIKIHIDSVLEPHTLQMYSTQGAYFGVVPVSTGKTNLTCLVSKKDHALNDKKLLFRLIKKFPALTIFLRENEVEKQDWLMTSSPEFNLKKLPGWSNAYWIGDALGSLPPAIGLGFAHSLNSGILAADYYLQNKPHVFLNISLAELNRKKILGKLMHQIMLNPLLTAMAFPLLKNFPPLLTQSLKRLGYYRPSDNYFGF